MRLPRNTVSLLRNRLFADPPLSLLCVCRSSLLHFLIEPLRSFLKLLCADLPCRCGISLFRLFSPMLRPNSLPTAHNGLQATHKFSPLLYAVLSISRGKIGSFLRDSSLCFPGVEARQASRIWNTDPLSPIPREATGESGMMTITARRILQFRSRRQKAIIAEARPVPRAPCDRRYPLSGRRALHPPP